ncbi:MAG: pyruvoyl-dependent arginine decarboxylase [Methanomicrobia archaeon]|nr:pyruvoyl-dependent arginine decarboxylase [Methanomicrobia archaeon]
MIPRAFFVTSGVGMDPEPAIAFDRALRDAGIGECNLVEVSSILPADAVVLDRKHASIKPGTITFCVLSRADGGSGDVVGAGVGYGWLGEEPGTANRAFGIIGEHHGHHARAFLAGKIQEKLDKMAAMRELHVLARELVVESVEVEHGKFGSVVVALVLLF